MDNEEKNIEEKNNNTGLVSIIFLLLIIVIGGFGFYTLVNLNNEDNTETTETSNETEDTEEVEVKELDVEDDVVISALGYLNVIAIDEEEAFTYGMYNVSSLTKEQLIATAFNESSILSACDESGEQTKLTIDDLNNSIQEVLVTDASLTIEDLTNSEYANSSYTGMTYEVADYGYSVNEDVITIVSSCGSEGVLEKQTITKATKATLEGDYLTIYQKVGFGKLNAEATDDVTYKFYSSSNRTDDFIEDKAYSEIENLTWDSYNTYKYIFKVENDNYKLESISLVSE